MWSRIYAFRNTLALVLAPLVLASIFLFVSPSKEARCLYTVLLMAIYWVFEVVPLPVTALLPLIVYPILGVSRAVDVAQSYMTDSLFLFFGGFMIALALEYSLLHKRLALRMLLTVGSDPRKLLLAVMSATACLSLFISNAAATGMMIPIVEAVLVEIVKDMRKSSGNPSPGEAGADDRNKSAEKTSQGKTSTDATPEHDSHDPQPTPSSPKESEMKKSAELKSVAAAKKGSTKVDFSNDQTTTTCSPIKLTPAALEKDELIICKMMIISTCYASSIGGIGTITGTPPNIIVFGFVEKTYGKETGLTYLSWILFALPIVILNTIFCWTVLWIYFLGFKSHSKNSRNSSVTDVIRHHYDKLGKMKYQEWTVACLFFSLVLLWIFHSPQFMPGWADFFPAKYVSGATPAIFAGFLLFALPKEKPDCIDSKEALMSWKWMQSKLPWDMILLMGGGFAMADGVEKSGLSVQIGNYLNYLVGMKAFLVCSIVVITASLTTEFTNNSAIVTIFTPIVNALAQQAKLNPLYLILSCGLSVSYAFMLPVGTPANAIVFGLGLITVLDMTELGKLSAVRCYEITFAFNISTLIVTLFANAMTKKRSTLPPPYFLQFFAEKCDQFLCCGSQTVWIGNEKESQPSGETSMTQTEKQYTREWRAVFEAFNNGLTTLLILVYLLVMLVLML